MARKSHIAARLLAGVSLTLMAAAACGAAYAADAAPDTQGSEGSSANEVIVTAEQGKAAANAPSKASLQEFQPESIISREYIEQATPETGGWVQAASVAPGLSGIPANGGGVGETTKLSMRGFQDGQFNITYDGIAFGDTNGPTHHEASYWPASTIGSVIVDRGPGAAGDLGQANFGGAIHFFSQDPSEKMGGVQKFTYGDFNTFSAVTNLNTGALPQLLGGRLLINLDERTSNGELSYSGGEAFNQLAKFVLPVGDKWTFTLFGSHNYTRFYQADSGPGETWAQVQAYGKDFALTNNPADEHYYGYNHEGKRTDFEYADMKGEVIPSFTFEDQLYSYYYSNRTWAANSVIDPVAGSTAPSYFTTAPNASSLINVATAGTPENAKTDIGGYYKVNQYRVYGDTVRLDKDWSFGTLKIGGNYEWSQTDRLNELYDFTQGYAVGNLGQYPDYKFQASKYPLLPGTTNAKTNENSAYQTWQVFGDFDWRPIDRLTISPGIKYIHSEIEVNAADENVAGATKNQPLVASNTYSSPLYFLTTNYRVLPDLAVYGQVATSFLLPGLPNLYYQAANIQSLQPERTTTYQGGVVYNRGNITADADIYRIDATDLQVNCTVDNEAATCNAGSARYTGVEGEAAYHLDFGLTIYANGALISAKQLANAANPGAGIAANVAETLANAPKWTDAIGAIYRKDSLVGTVTYKQSGAYVPVLGASYTLPGYDSLDGSVGYDFGRVALKLQAFNLLDKRAITGFNGSVLYSTKDTGLYTFQSGREVQATISAKF
jgi:iron complex outermembrane receptor protein